MYTEGPLRTRRSLAPSHLDSQWAESTACYVGAFNLACRAYTNAWLPFRLRYAGGSAPEEMEGGSNEEGQVKRKRRRRGPEERQERGEEKQDRAA